MSDIARVLTNLEAIVGQMHSTVFIAILVGGYLAPRSKEIAEKQNTNQAGTIVISHLGKDSERCQKGVYCSNSFGGTLIAFS